MTAIKQIKDALEKWDTSKTIGEGLNCSDKLAELCTPLRMREVLAHIAAQDAEIARLKDDLQFVERWANHHGQKPHMTAQEALSCIQHYPPILAITKGYADGKVPVTYDPYAEIERLRKMLAGDNGALSRMDRARGWLTNDNPRSVCNWGVLDTEDMRTALATKPRKAES